MFPKFSTFLNQFREFCAEDPVGFRDDFLRHDHSNCTRLGQANEGPGSGSEVPWGLVNLEFRAGVKIKQPAF